MHIMLIAGFDIQHEAGESSDRRRKADKALDSTV